MGLASLEVVEFREAIQWASKARRVLTQKDIFLIGYVGQRIRFCIGLLVSRSEKYVFSLQRLQWLTG